MKTYEVTLARLAWIKGSVTVRAETWGDAFVKAKAIEDQANWPIGEDGDTLIGFGDVEIDSAYCPSESDGHHDGEAPAADVEVYRAAPLMAEAIKLVMRCARGELERPVTERQPWPEAEAALNRAVVAAGLEV